MDGPLVPGPALAPVSGRVELPHRPGLPRQPLLPIVGLPDCEDGDGVISTLRRRLRRRSAALRPADRPRGLDGRPRVAPASRSRRTIAPRAIRACRRTWTSTSRRSRLGELSSRSVRANSGTTRREHRVANGPHPRQRVARLRLGRAMHRPTTVLISPTGAARAPGAARTRTTRRSRSRRSPTITTERMRAQVRNPADGWNDPPTPHRPNPSRSTRPDQGQLHPRRHRRRGLAEARELGYKLTIPISMARLQRLHRDLPRVPARRPLPQGADGLGTALERLPGHAARPHGPPPPERALPPTARRAAAGAEVPRRPWRQRYARRGARPDRARRPIAAYEATLPDDGRPPWLDQPADVERFGAAFFTLERRLQLHRQPRGRGSAPRPARAGSTTPTSAGELPVTLEFPHGTDVPSYLSGGSSGTGRRTSRRSSRSSTPARAGWRRPPGPTASSSTGPGATAGSR